MSADSTQFRRSFRGPGLGRSDANLLDAAYAALPPGGRLVVNAVTLEAAVDLARRLKAQGGDLVRIEIARANPLGTFYTSGMRL